jgi:acetyl-CoA carboxylase carboxyltransferase component
MNSKALGADVVLAWPEAQLGVMGAEQAVAIVSRREIAAAADPALARRRLARAYAGEHLGVDRASAEGYVDEVIAPASTRERIAASLSALSGCERVRAPATNIPL